MIHLPWDIRDAVLIKPPRHCGRAIGCSFLPLQTDHLWRKFIDNLAETAGLVSDLRKGLGPGWAISGQRSRDMMHYSGFRVFWEGLTGHKGWGPAWRDPASQAAYDYVIVGGGGHGLATA